MYTYIQAIKLLVYTKIQAIKLLVYIYIQAILLRANSALPEVLAVRKWQTGIPQYTVGHKQIVDAVRTG